MAVKRADTIMVEIERRQARIIAGAIKEVAATSNEPKDRPHDYPEAAINLLLTNLTQLTEECLRRAAGMEAAQ